MGQSTTISRRKFVGYSGAAVGLSAMAVTGLSACVPDETSESSDGPPSRPTGTLTRSYAAETETLNPALAIAGGLLFTSIMYEGLVRINSKTQQIEPGLATEWEANAEATRYSFKLREGVKFHNGDTFNSAAVKATFDYFEKQAGFAASLVPEFKNVDTSDPYSIVFELAKPDGDFLRNQAFLRIMSPQLLSLGQKAIESSPAGTGAFAFDSRQKNSSITLKANPDYWQGDRPYLKSIDFKLLTDSSARINAFVSGQLDQTNSVAPNAMAQVEGRQGTQVAKNPGWRISYLHFTVTNPNVADKRIRQAVAYALDRQTIIEKLLGGQATLATSVVPEGIYGHAEAATVYDYDPDKARQLIAEAGLGDNHPIRIGVSPGLTVQGQDVATAVQGYLKDVGFDATLDVITAEVLQSELGDPVPAHDLYYNEHSWLTGGPVIFTIGLIEAISRFSNPEYAALNTRQQTLPDGQERLDVLQQMQDIMADEAPYIALHVPYQIDASADTVRDYSAPPDQVSYDYRSVYKS